MAPNKSPRRMPLHQLLAHTEKHNRDLIDFVHTELHAKIVDLRELTTTLAAGERLAPKALQNALQHVDETGSQFLKSLDEFVEALAVIHDQANRDRLERQK